MKPQKLILLIVVIFTFTSCSNMMRNMMKNKMMVHYSSQYDFNTTVDTLKNAFDASSIWVILEEKNNAKIYEEEGNIGNYIELHLCHPATAYKIITNDETQYMAAMIPLQLCIYEDSENEVKISVMDTKMMAKMFKDDEVKQTVEKASMEMKSILERIEY
jgi:uncharacterized protein (DUF302 family)